MSFVKWVHRSRMIYLVQHETGKKDIWPGPVHMQFYGKCKVEFFAFQVTPQRRVSQFLIVFMLRTCKKIWANASIQDKTETGKWHYIQWQERVFHWWKQFFSRRLNAFNNSDWSEWFSIKIWLDKILNTILQSQIFGIKTRKGGWQCSVCVRVEGGGLVTCLE